MVTAAFLRSPEYAELMLRHVPDPANVDPHEANVVSDSYRFRHADMAKVLGVWRWRGIARHAGTILQELEREGAKVVDFGGAGGPLGLGSVLVDTLAPTKSLSAVTGATCVFTSHTLEHVPDLDAVLAQIAACLVPGGLLIAHVPAWTCVRWRAGIHESGAFGAHVWDFGLEDAKPESSLRAYTNISQRIAAAGLDVELAEYCGDDSIMVMARKPGEPVDTLGGRDPDKPCSACGHYYCYHADWPGSGVRCWHDNCACEEYDAKLSATAESATQSEPPPTPVRIYKFGPWPTREMPAKEDATPLGARVMEWLVSGKGDMDPDLSRLLHVEFMAQERYRQGVVHVLRMACKQLEERQIALKSAMGQPNGAGEEFAHGFSAGQQLALLECAQMMQDALNGASDAAT